MFRVIGGNLHGKGHSLQGLRRLLCSGVGPQVSVTNRLDDDRKSENGSANGVQQYDVAIVGGGMVGMALACSLASSPFLTRKLRVAIIDDNPTLTSADLFSKDEAPDPRVSTITPASISFLQDIGAWKYVEQQRHAYFDKMQYLDENKSLILKIVESQNSGKLNECAENQARLQRNLMYLAAIADAQPQQAAMHSQYPQSSMMQSGGHYMQQHQQSQQMTPQALMAARSSMMYSQQAYSALQQSQMGLSMLHSQGGEPHNSAGSSGILGGGAYSDFGRGLKHEMGSSEGRGGSSGDGEGLYLKSGEDGH